MQMALQRHTRSVGVGPSLSAASGAANFLAFYSRSLSLHHTYISFPFHSFISHLTLLWSLLAPTLSFLYTPPPSRSLSPADSRIFFASLLSFLRICSIFTQLSSHSFARRASHFVTTQRTVKNHSSKSLCPFQSSAGQSVHLTHERVFNFLLNTFVKHGALDSDGPESHFARKTEILPRTVVHKVTQARTQCSRFDYFRIRQGISKTPSTNNLPPA